jgi:hypothetical protein
MPTQTTTRQDTENRRPHVAAIAVTQLAVLLVLGWALVAWLNWSSNAAMAEFIAAPKPPVVAPGEPHASIPLRPAHHRSAICPRRA